MPTAASRSRSSFDRAHSFLFAPGDDAHKLQRALATPAHAVIADLEDAVAPRAKDRAREVVADVFEKGSSRCLRIVRVNAVQSPYFADDMEWIARLPVDGMMLPKASAEAIAGLSEGWPPIVALLETAVGIRDAAVIAEFPGVHALALGSIDLAAEVGMQRRVDGQGLLYARSKLVIESAAAGIRPPIDTVHTAFRDAEGLQAEARLARTLGMGGKLCVHPLQVEMVNTIFAPAPEEVQTARELIAAYESSLKSGRGVADLKGEMIDMALLKRARRVLDSADEVS